MTFSNIPDVLIYEIYEDNVRFQIGNISTNWMAKDDSFIVRIDENNLNHFFLTQHLIKEIEIKNILDEGESYLNKDNFSKAIEKFDEVLFYDPDYSAALISKSYALFGQKHFVKALRYYKRAIKSDNALKDVSYHKTLLKEANDERDNFPKLKSNIYAGDEYFAKGEYENAVDSYDRALANPSKFKDKILSKLLNKKATALLKLEEYEEALACFKESRNDYAVFGEGCCEHELGMEITDRFKAPLDITKRQMLRQSQILNKSGYFAESLLISDYLFKNHFKVDDLYFELLSARKCAMDSMNMDSSEIEDILNKISE